MIVVVGAGLIGLAIAFEVARRGGEVRVVDAHEPAAAASWAGAGMLAPYTESLASPAFEALCADSLARYPRFVADVRDAGGIDARLHLDGIVDAAFDAAAVQRGQARVAALSARGIAARWLDREAALLLEPALGSHVLGAVHSLTEGHVDNRRLGRALRAACAALGVRVDANAGDIVLEADERRVLGVRGPFGFVPARAVVNAAGAWAGALAGVPDRAKLPVFPVKGQMLAIAIPQKFVRRVVWIPGNAYVAHPYLVPRDDGRLLVGATVENGHDDTRVTARGIQALLAAVLAVMPALGDFAVAETWAGVRPGSPDGMPYLGETSLTGYFTATGHYRNGILLAPATAHVMADVLEGKPGDALAPFAPGRASGEAMLAR
jgi:glycine oxidase